MRRFLSSVRGARTALFLFLAAATSALAQNPNPPPQVLVITNQPMDVTVPDSAPATFTVGIFGMPISYAQWFHDGTPIPNGNGLTLTIANAQAADAGNYWLVASNSVSSVTSSSAFLTVAADTNSPIITKADGTASPADIVVSFNERLLPITATNFLNYYLISNIGSGITFTPTRATLAQNGSNVSLVIPARSPNTNYLLIVHGIRDASARTNLIAANFSVPITRLVTLADETSLTYYYNPVPVFGDDPVPTNIWRQAGFYPYADDPNRSWADTFFSPGIAWRGGNNLPGLQGAQLARTDSSTVYFVTPFDFYGSPLGSSVALSYLVDDGAIFSLNETEFLRVGLPPGPIAWSNAATRAAYPPTWIDLPLFPGAGPAYGLNSLATELHTAGPFDTNFDFAARITAEISSYALGPVVITTQPTNWLVTEGSPVAFSFFAAGAAQFQWFMNNSPIAGATNPTYFITSAGLTLNSNKFHVRAYNASSSATSTDATLRVLPDTNAPVLLSAYVCSSNTILVSFSEMIDPVSGQTLANYAIIRGPSAGLTIQSAVVTNGTNVLLTVLPGGTGQYTVVVNGLKDTAVAGNVIARNSAQTIGLSYTIPIDAVWKYNAAGIDLGAAWRELAFSDVSWPEGAGLLYNETSPIPEPKNTVVPTRDSGGNYIHTFYFRRRFSLAVGSASVLGSLRHVIDDGAVMYMNNQEFHRFNMAPGTIAYGSLANTNVQDAVYSPAAGAFSVVFNNIGGGDNVCAVEVHQATPASDDIVFGAELVLSAPSFGTYIPDCPSYRISTQRLPGGDILLTWCSPIRSLQRTTALSHFGTNWTTVATGTTSYTISRSNLLENAFFRLNYP